MSRIEIPCGQDAEAYTAILEAADLGVFKQAAARYSVRGKEGEALVAAIVETAFGKVTLVERYNQNGNLSDSPQGLAAREIFGDFAKLESVERCKDGGPVTKLMLAERQRYATEKSIIQTTGGAVRALPQVLRFMSEIEISCGTGAGAYKTVISADDLDTFAEILKNDDVKNKTGEALVSALLTAGTGKIKTLRRIRDDKYNDAPTGEPASIDFYEGGREMHIRYCTDGQWNTAANGTPALLTYLDGKLVSACNYDKGNHGGALSEQEIADYLEKKSIMDSLGSKVKVRFPKP